MFTLTLQEHAEMAALDAFGGPEDGPHVTFTPVAGEAQLDGRVGRGACFKPDGKGGGKLYTNAAPGARLLARVRRGP